MPLDSEPKNGDFAAYIEALSRRGAAAGQTLRELDSHIGSRASQPAPAGPAPYRAPPPARRNPLSSDDPDDDAPDHSRRWNDMPELPPDAEQGDGFGAPDAGAAPYTPYTPSAGHTSSQTVRSAEARTARNAGRTEHEPDTLAAQGAGLMQGVFLSIAGVVVGVLGLGKILSDLDDPLGGVFLIFMAGLLIRAGRNARRKANARLGKLPPLSTVATSNRSR